MRPADHEAQLHPIAPRHHLERKQADQPAWRAGRPHQDGLDIAAECRRRRQRKARIVEHVGLGGAGRELAPRRDDIGKRRQRAALGRQHGVRGRQHGITAPRGRPR